MDRFCPVARLKSLKAAATSRSGQSTRASSAMSACFSMASAASSPSWLTILRRCGVLAKVTMASSPYCLTKRAIVGDFFAASLMSRSAVSLDALPIVLRSISTTPACATGVKNIPVAMMSTVISCFQRNPMVFMCVSANPLFVYRVL